MANTYSQIHVQLVFAVKYRRNLLHGAFRRTVFKYMTSVANNKSQKAIIVNGASDHVHLLLSLRPVVYIPKLVNEVKTSATRFINGSGILPCRFCWQEGYSVFSYSRKEVPRLYNYILNQEEHHKTETFRQEYMAMLERHGVDYDPRFLFDFYDL